MTETDPDDFTPAERMIHLRSESLFSTWAISLLFKLLVQKGVISQDELSMKISETIERWSASPDPGGMNPEVIAHAVRLMEVSLEELRYL